MNNNRLRILMVFCLGGMLAFSAGISCKKADEAREPTAQPVGESRNAPAAAEEQSASNYGSDEKKEEGAAGGRKDEGRRGIIGHFLAPMELAKERLLEYQVDLTYESRELQKSRMMLLGLVSKYGFVREADTSLNNTPQLVHAYVAVKSDKIYDALVEFDRVGTLLEENIRVVDHTEAMVQEERTFKREQLRIGRKNMAAVQVAPAAKNWVDIENSLAQSEDKLDASEQKKWGIRDKVAWAVIRVKIQGPDRVEVPNYGNAFIGLLNFTLRLLYALIYIVPFVVIAGLIFWKRKKILGLFRRTK